MAKITGENLTRWVRHICGASVEDGIFYIRKEESLVLLDACLQHEVQHMNRKTMIKSLKLRIRKLEKGSPCVAAGEDGRNYEKSMLCL